MYFLPLEGAFVAKWKSFMTRGIQESLGLDSTVWISDFMDWISGFLVSGTWIPNSNHWWNSTLQIPLSLVFRIPPQQKFPEIRIPFESPTWGESVVTKTNFIFLTSIFLHRAGSITGLLLLIALAFGIFICCLRRKLPDGVPKPPVCTTVKVNHWKYTLQIFWKPT